MDMSSDQIIAKAKQVKLLICDVDGVLSNGYLYLNNESISMKAFHVHDGQGLKLLMDSGVDVAIITTCTSDIVRKRMDDLGIQHVYRGYKEKLPAYQDLMAKLQLQDNEVAYVGDDVPDLPLIRRAGLGIAVGNATTAVAKYADTQTKAYGGQGAVREICEMIMQSQGTYDKILANYLEV